MSTARISTPGKILIVSLVLSTPTSGCLMRAPRRPRAELVHLRQGAHQLQAGDLDRAEAHFSVAAAYNRRSAEALNGLGLVALARGEKARARELFTRALALNEDLAEAQNNLGVLELQRGKWRPAATRFQAALDVDPGYHQARFNHARALFQGGLYRRARQELLLVTSSRPQLAPAWSALAMVSVAMRRRAAAGRALRQARLRAPGAVHVLVAEGMLRRVGGDLKGALKALARACKKQPGNLDARLQYGLTLIRARRFGEATRALRRVLTRRPFAARIHFALGYLAAMRRNLSAARKAFRRAAELEPRYWAAWLHLAATQLALGKPKEAHKSCLRLARLRSKPARKAARRCHTLLAAP